MQPYNNSAFPRLGDMGMDQGDVNVAKNAHDSYDIYVNQEYLGKKDLLTQTEDIEDVMDFLKKQGVQNAFGKVDGDHYDITAHDPEHVKQIMKVYLQNR